jgi:hypothetical protein
MVRAPVLVIPDNSPIARYKLYTRMLLDLQWEWCRYKTKVSDCNMLRIMLGR